MILRICDNNYCHANLDTIINGLLTVTVVVLVLQRLGSRNCERLVETEIGQMGRECPCGGNQSPQVLQDPGPSSQLQSQDSSIPDWWQFKTWALEKLPDVARPFNPSQILSPGPNLKFKDTDAPIDRKVVSTFDFGSTSRRNPILPCDGKALQQQSLASSTKVRVLKQGPPLRDQDGWILTRQRGWVRGKKNQEVSSYQIVPKPKNQKTSSTSTSPRSLTARDNRKPLGCAPKRKPPSGLSTPSARSKAKGKKKIHEISVLKKGATVKRAGRIQNASGSSTPSSVAFTTQGKLKEFENLPTGTQKELELSAQSTTEVQGLLAPIPSSQIQNSVQNKKNTFSSSTPISWSKNQNEIIPSDCHLPPSSLYSKQFPGRAETGVYGVHSAPTARDQRQQSSPSSFSYADTIYPTDERKENPGSSAVQTTEKLDGRETSNTQRIHNREMNGSVSSTENEVDITYSASFATLAKQTQDFDYLDSFQSSSAKSVQKGHVPWYSVFPIRVKEIGPSSSSTPSTGTNYYSFPTSSVSSPSSSAMTLDRPEQSGCCTPLKDVTNARVDLVNYRSSDGGPKFTTIDANDFIRNQNKKLTTGTTELASNVGESRPSPRTSITDNRGLSTMSVRRSRRRSNSWSSQWVASPEASSLMTYAGSPVEALDLATPASPISSSQPLSKPFTSVEPSSSQSASQAPSDLQHMDFMLSNDGLLNLRCCQSIRQGPPSPTPCSSTPVSHDVMGYFPGLRKALMLKQDQGVPADFVDERLLEFQTCGNQGLMGSSEKPKQSFSASCTSGTRLKRSVRPSLQSQRSFTSSRTGNNSKTSEGTPTRRKLIWEPGAWPDSKYPQGCDRFEKSVKRRSKRSSTHEGLPRLAVASIVKPHLKRGSRKASSTREGKRSAILREQQFIDDQARRISVNYAEQVIQDSAAQALPINMMQDDSLTNINCLRNAPPTLPQYFDHQGQTILSSIPVNAHPFPETMPLNFQQNPESYSMAVDDRELMRTMLLDYQGYPTPSFMPMASKLMRGLPNQCLHYQRYVAASSINSREQDTAFSTSSQDYPVAPPKNLHTSPIAPSTNYQGNSNSFPDVYRYPLSLHPSQQGYPTGLEMHYQSYPSAYSTIYPRPGEASTMATHRYPPPWSQTFNGDAAISSNVAQEHPTAPPGTIQGDLTFSITNRRVTKGSSANDHVENSKQQTNFSTSYRKYSKSSSVDMEPDVKELLARPLEVPELKTNLNSLEDTLSSPICESLAKRDSGKEGKASTAPQHKPKRVSIPQVEWELTHTPQLHPIPGDVVVLFSSLLPSVDRESTFIYFHPNQSKSDLEPRKGNMAVVDDNDQRALLLRYGEIDRNGLWVPNIQVKLFYTGGNDTWSYVTKTFVTNLPWVHRSRRSYARLRMPDPHFKPRSGDLMVRTALPKTTARELEEVQQQQNDEASWVLIWWDHNNLAVTDDMIVRAYVGPAPKKNNQPSYSLLGRVELYTKRDQDYLFMGKDQHHFAWKSKTRKGSNQRLCRVLPTKFCCS